MPEKQSDNRIQLGHMFFCLVLICRRAGEKIFKDLIAYYAREAIL